jgi:hypothetical protein
MKITTALLTGAALLGASAPAVADDFPGRAIREGVAEIDRDRESRGDNSLGEPTAAAREARRDDRRDAREDRREDRREWRDDRRDDRRDWRDDRRDWRDDRRDWRHDRWDDRRDRARYGYGYGYDRGYRYGWDSWRGRWTPYGFGYYDRATSLWAFRHFDDNRNGRLSEREWRNAQRAFYRLADRNRDGYIDRREYVWATDFIGRGYAYRW